MAFQTNGTLARILGTVRQILKIGGALLLVYVVGSAIYMMYLFRDAGKPEPELPTVDGPEATDLAGKAQGCVVLYTPYPDDLVGVEISSGLNLQTITKLRLTRPWCGDRCSADNIEGPDDTGRIVFVESNRFGSPISLQAPRYDLVSVRVGETGPNQIFSRSNATSYVEDLVLSPHGGKVAFLSIDPKSAEIPGTYRKPGVIEIWDVDQRKGGPTRTTALQVGLSWFPDGKRLAYVGASGEESGILFILNLETGEKTPILVKEDNSSKKEPLRGDFPIVSQDGLSILVSPGNQNWNEPQKTFQLVDLKSGESTFRSLPTRSRAGPIALFKDAIVLYRGLPTTGVAQKLDFRKFRMQTYKISDFKTGHFQTIVPYVEHNTSGRYGSCNGFEGFIENSEASANPPPSEGVKQPIKETEPPIKKERAKKRYTH